MNPALSVILLTVLSGAAQGLAVLLALAFLAGGGIDAAFAARAFATTLLLSLASLVASFFHLGRPSRAWRAASMWRTSWLSREVIVLPAFLGATAVWWWGAAHGLPRVLTHVAGPLVVALLAFALWICTAKIYACLRFVEEWAQPLTPVNFVLVGLASGFVLGTALLGMLEPHASLSVFGAAAVVLTVAAGVGRGAALARNAAIQHRSTVQTATGIASPTLRQVSMGMTGGSFNTREFFHRASAAGVRRIRVVALGLGYALPALVGVLAIAAAAPSLWWLAVALQLAGLMADRWLFFAQAKHPQNLYYDRVS